MNTNFLTGPISKKYCLYFYFLTLFSGIVLILGVIHFFFSIFKKKINWMSILNGVIVLLFGFFNYISYRLFYNMCINSI